jgi:hypothetical protein
MTDQSNSYMKTWTKDYVLEDSLVRLDRIISSLPVVVIEADQDIEIGYDRLGFQCIFVVKEGMKFDFDAYVKDLTKKVNDDKYHKDYTSSMSMIRQYDIISNMINACRSTRIINQTYNINSFRPMGELMIRTTSDKKVNLKVTHINQFFKDSMGNEHMRFST